MAIHRQPKLSHETIDKYIKTSTYGAAYTQLFKRLLFFFCLAIWALGALWLYEPTKQGFIGLKEYYEEKIHIERMKSIYDKYDMAKYYLQECIQATL